MKVMAEVDPIQVELDRNVEYIRSQYQSLDGRYAVDSTPLELGEFQIVEGKDTLLEVYEEEIA